MDLQRLKGLTNRAIDAKKDAEEVASMRDSSAYVHICGWDIKLTATEVRIIVDRYVAEKMAIYKEANNEIYFLRGE